MEIYKQMREVSLGMPHIEKNQQGYGHTFRGIDQVQNELGPLLKKHKIIITRHFKDVFHSVRSVETKKGKKEYTETKINCCYRFTSMVDGSFIETEGVGEAQDSAGSDKSTGAAQSNAFKYMVFEMFAIPTEEQQDSDQVTAENHRLGLVKEVNAKATSIVNSFKPAIRAKAIEQLKKDVGSLNEIGTFTIEKLNETLTKLEKFEYMENEH